MVCLETMVQTGTTLKIGKKEKMLIIILPFNVCLHIFHYAYINVQLYNIRQIVKMDRPSP